MERNNFKLSNLFINSFHSSEENKIGFWCELLIRRGNICGVIKTHTFKNTYHAFAKKSETRIFTTAVTNSTFVTNLSINCTGHTYLFSLKTEENSKTREPFDSKVTHFKTLLPETQRN